MRTIYVLFLTVQILSASAFSITGFAVGTGVLSAESSSLLSPGSPAASGQPAPGYTLSEKSYFTDNLGNVLMYVNVWGAFGRTGRFAVPQDTDIPTMLSIVGGPSKDAKLTKMIIFRQEPDEFGKQLYMVNIKKMTKEGDTTDFIELRPNDTIIMSDKSQIFTFGNILGGVSSVFSIMSLIHK